MERDHKDYRRSQLLDHINRVLAMEDQLKKASMAAFVALAEAEQSTESWENEHAEG